MVATFLRRVVPFTITAQLLFLSVIAEAGLLPSLKKPSEILDAGRERSTPALVCGSLGATLGNLLGDEKDAIWAGVGSAVFCTAMVHRMEQKRVAAIEQEESLDDQINQQRLSNEELSKENDNLRRELTALQGQAKALESERKFNPKRAVEVAADIQAAKDSASKRIQIIDARIDVLKERISSPDSTDAQRKDLNGTIANLSERRALLVDITEVEAA